MTPFGRFMRSLRLDRGLLLKQVADLLSVSPAYLSALEHGKKGVPSREFLKRIIEALALDEAFAEELSKAVRDSETALTLSPKTTPFAFEIANAFARQLPSLTEAQLKRIRGILDE